MADVDAGLDDLLALHPTAGVALRAAAGRLRAAGGAPFEVIVGSSAGAGVRVTWRPGEPDGGAALAAAAGVGDHPWGPPDWVGLRAGADGTARCKAYHRRPPPLGITPPHRGLVPECDPVMAALDADAVEVYATLPSQLGWDEFAARALAALPSVPARPDFRPRPRARAHGFGMSARHRGGRVEAITVYALRRALPDDETVIAEWSAGLGAAEHAAYAAAVATAAGWSRSLTDLHGLLAWSFDAGGGQSRAASLRVPVHSSG